MSHGPSQTETEIKLAVGDAAHTHELLTRAGFPVSRERVFESNVLFDNAERAMWNAGTVLRIREVGSSGVLTYKGPADSSLYKTREELELDIADPQTLRTVLERLGFAPAFRYEKFRTEYRSPASEGLVTLDETPIGVYLELEGAPEWIDATAAALGFSPADYINLSYVGLYLAFCERTGQTPRDMTFSP